MMLHRLGEFGYLLLGAVQNVRFVWQDRRRVVQQLAVIGTDSVPIVLLIGLFAGAIMAWQAAYQFKGMVSLSILGGQASRALAMEMAPVLAALIMSGRVGASMAAEIGSMVVTEQIDALRVMSLDPVRYLVMPRFVAMTVMMPVLNLFAFVMALGGAFVVSSYFLGVTPQVFFQSVQDYFSLGDLGGGMAKSGVFGMLISLIGCYKGLYTTGGAQGVGRATISSFVLAALMVLVSDFMLWVVLF